MALFANEKKTAATFGMELQQTKATMNSATVESLYESLDRLQIPAKVPVNLQEWKSNCIFLKEAKSLESYHLEEIDLTTTSLSSDTDRSSSPEATLNSLYTVFFNCGILRKAHITRKRTQDST
jgi:hypothetical protein